MRIPLATLLAFLVIAAPAAGQATATATPDEAGKGTKLHLELDATQPPVAGRLPSSTTLSAQAGYKFDGRAVAKRCTEAQAEEDRCPAKSRSGSAVITASFGGSQYVVPVALYLAKPQRAGDLAGVAVIATVFGSPYAAMGRVVTTTTAPYGLSVILPTPVDLSSLSVTFERFVADIGATRKVTKGSRKKGNRRKVRYHLLRNPKTCTAPWASRADFTFPDGSSAFLEAPISCTA